MATKDLMRKQLLNCEDVHSNDDPLTIPFGNDDSGNLVLHNFHEFPHLIIGGKPGSGIVTFEHSIICSILERASPDQVCLILVDTTGVYFSKYNQCAHLMAPAITDPCKASEMLSWLLIKMMKRYEKLSNCEVRNYLDYNVAHRGTDKHMPAIVVIIDDLSCLLNACRKDVEELICRLSAVSRAAGIYLVLATQYPSNDALNGVIKAGIPSRVSFSVSSRVESLMILGAYGAEKLEGKGEMLLSKAGPFMQHVFTPLLDEGDIATVISHVTTCYLTKYNKKLMKLLG